MKNIRNYIPLLIILLLIGILGSRFLAGTSQSKPEVKEREVTFSPSKSAIQTKKEDKKTLETILGATTLLAIAPHQENCTGPDGILFRALKLDCESLNSFWSRHKPSTPSSSSTNSSSSSASSSSSNPTPTPTVTPTPSQTPEIGNIIDVKVAACSSSSCEKWLTTVIIYGQDLPDAARAELFDGSKTYSEKTSHNYFMDAQYVGGDEGRKVITDFYYLPHCTEFGVRLYTADGAIITTDETVTSYCAL